MLGCRVEPLNESDLERMTQAIASLPDLSRALEERGILAFCVKNSGDVYLLARVEGGDGGGRQDKVKGFRIVITT